MTMPRRHVQVRHGQSEANVVQKELLGELDPAIVAEIYARPDWMQRLSPLGQEPARYFVLVSLAARDGGDDVVAAGGAAYDAAEDGEQPARSDILEREAERVAFGA